ncbi:MAG: 2-hydroxycarboxylate transporter family protein, partial [Steroidobacteraceae bacterium]
MTNVAIPAWARAWQRVLEWRIGIVPVPVFVLLAAMTWYFVAADKVVTDLPTMIAVVALFGFACAEIGQRIPGIRSVGGG